MQFSGLPATRSPFVLLRRLALVSGTALLVSCAGASDNVFNPVPTLRFVGLSQSVVRAADVPGGSNDLDVILEFTDGDGDLGVDEGDDRVSVRVVDTRPGFPYQVGGTNGSVTIDSVVSNIVLPRLVPEDDGRAISGTIRLNLTGVTFVRPQNVLPANLAFTGPTQEVRFRIQIFDRAGNASNVVLTAPLTLTR